MVARAAAPLGGLMSLLCQACASGAIVPDGHATAAAPRLLLVDVDAGTREVDGKAGDGASAGDRPGALFEIDPASHVARRLALAPEVADPVDVVGEPDGSLLVLDLAGIGGDGKLWRLAADGSGARRVALTAPLVDPTAMARAPDGSLWIVDRGAAFARAPGPGALWRLTPDLSRCELVMSGPPLAAPSDLCFVGDRLFVLDADALRRDVADLSEGALYRVDPTAARASERLQLVAALHLVSPLSLAPWPDAGGGDRFLITDVNADPRDRRRLTGAVYLLDGIESGGSVSLFAQDPAWRDPSCGTLRDGSLLVVDGSADPLQLGDDPVGKGYAGKGRGGVYEVDLSTRSIRLFGASPEFVNPTRLRIVP